MAQTTVQGPNADHLGPNTTDETPEKGWSFKKIIDTINTMFSDVYSLVAAVTITANAAAPAVVTSGIGAAAGTGVVAAESGDGAVHKTVLTLTNLSVTMTDAGAAGSQGSQKVYDFPEGPIQLLGASYNLTTARVGTAIGATAALVGSLGSVAAGAGDATLTSTEADMIASTTGTLTAGAGTLKKHGSLVATAFDGHTTALDAILNLAVPDADSSGNDAVTVNGTITLTWANLGDY